MGMDIDYMCRSTRMTKRGNARVSLCQANRNRMIMGHLSREMNLKWNCVTKARGT